MHLQKQIVNMLRLGLKDKASQKLLEFQNHPSISKAEDFMHILDYCARTPDPLFIVETWKIMNEKAVYIDKKCWSCIIQALSDGGYLKEAFNQLAFLGNNDTTRLYLPLYNIFLNGCVKAQNVTYANNCLDFMEKQLVGKNEITYWELLKLAVMQENISLAHEIWKNVTKYYNPSIISLRKFIWCFVRLGDLQSSYNILQHMVSMMGGPHHLMISSKGRISSSMLDIPIPLIQLPDGQCGNVIASNVDKVMMQEKDLEVDLQTDTRPAILKILRWSFSDLIHAYAQCEKYEMAEKLFVQMHDLGIKPSAHTFDGFVRAVISKRGLTYAMRVVKEMEKRNLKPNNDTFSALVVGYSKILDLDMSVSFLDKITDNSPKYIHPFNAVLAACNIMDKPERAICILNKMKQSSIRPNIRTFELLFSLFGNVNAPYEDGDVLSHLEVRKRVQTLESYMSSYGVQHSFVSLENLIRALGSEGMIKEMLQFLYLAESLLLHPQSYSRTSIYNTVLHFLVEARESHIAIEVFQNMIAGDFLTDATTYNIMIDCCALLRCCKSASALVSLMLRRGYLPQRVTYTALLKVYLANEDFDSAVRLVERLISERMGSDALLFNTVLLEAEKKGRIDVIEYIVELMHQQEIRPDPATCSYVFSAYVNQDFYNTAVEALQVLSMRMILEDENILPEKRALFEGLVYSENPDAESWIADIFEGDEHLAAALLNLRWCAIAGYSISWSPRHSFWSRRLSLCYDSVGRVP